MPETLVSQVAEPERKPVQEADPENKEAKKDIDHAVSLLMDMLDPEGPYRWNLPAKPLKVGDEGYNYYVCRTSTYTGHIFILHSLVRGHKLPEAQADVVAKALKKIDEVNSKEGMKTIDDMIVLRNKFTDILFSLLEITD